MPRAAALKARSSLAAALAGDGASLSPESRRVALLRAAADDAESDSADDFAASRSHSAPSAAEEDDEPASEDNAASEDEEMSDAGAQAGSSSKRKQPAGARGKGRTARRATPEVSGKQDAAQGAQASRGVPYFGADGFSYHLRQPALVGALYASPRATHVLESQWPRDGARPQTEMRALELTVERTKRYHAAAMMTAGQDIDVGWWPGKQRAQQHAAGSTAEGSDKIGMPFQLDVAPPVLLEPAEAAPYLAPLASTSSAQPLHPPEVNERLDEQDPVRFVEAPPAATSDVLHLTAGLAAERRKIAIARGQSLRLDSLGLSDPGGHALDAGGHVYGVDFRPTPVPFTEPKEYLVVSASSAVAPRTMLGEAAPRPAPAALQIWSVSAGPAGAATQELLLCHDFGTATQVSWCPAGHDHRAAGSTPRRLGVLAGVFSTGVVAVFAVPHPDDLKAGGTVPRAVKLEPVVLLEVPATCLSWGGGERLAAGCMNGHVVVWPIGDVLRAGKRTALPSHYFEVHDAGILSLAWEMLPPLDFDGEPQEDELPHVVTTASLDGQVICCDIDDPWMTDAKNFTRAHPQITAWSAHLGGVLAERPDEGTTIGLVGNRADTRGQFHSLTAQPGRALSLATTPNHVYYARTSTDGAVYVSSILIDATERRRASRMTQPVYCLDINRSTGELLMKDQLLPRPAYSEDAPTLGWHPRVAVTASAWCPNAGRGLLLATGAACGLVRIDWLGHHLRFEGGEAPEEGAEMQDADDAEEEDEGEEEEEEDGHDD